MRTKKKGPSNEVIQRAAKKLKAELESPEFATALREVNKMSHMRCPVCRFDKTYSGPCCPECAKLGYKLNPKTGRMRRAGAALLLLLTLANCAGLPARTKSTDPVLRVAIDADSMAPGSYARLVFALVQSGKFIVVDRAAGLRAIAKEQEIQHTTTRFGVNEKYALWGKLYGVGGIFVGVQQCESKLTLFQNPYQRCVQNLSLIDATTGEVLAVAELTLEGDSGVAVEWTESVEKLVAAYPLKFKDATDLHRTVDYDDALKHYRDVTVPEASKASKKMDHEDQL